MEANELFGPGPSNCTKGFLARGHQYKHIIASYLGFVISIEDLQVKMTERVVSAWEQPRLRWISVGTPLQTPFDEFRSLPPAAHFGLIYRLRYPSCAFLTLFL